MFVVLCALLQLNLLSTRNPDIWWWFSKKGAPAPSLGLVGLMTIFLLVATFVGVYWPSHVRPDGGRGWMEGAGQHTRHQWPRVANTPLSPLPRIASQPLLYGHSCSVSHAMV